MGIFKGFICDKCGKEFISNSKDYNPTTISIAIKFGSTAPSTYPNIKEHQIWCRECLRKTNFCAPPIPEDKKIAPVTELTFEEKFSIMIEELGFIKEL